VELPVQLLQLALQGQALGQELVQVQALLLEQLQQ
jgi:hypothetical protein